MYLIDTNVISELRKGARCDLRVAAWHRTVQADDLFLSVLVVGEIRQGIERLRPRHPARAGQFEAWLNELTAAFGERVLPVDAKVADRWGRIGARGHLPAIDALLAATAEANGLILATRNLKDIERSGVRCVNPFEFAG